MSSAPQPTLVCIGDLVVDLVIAVEELPIAPNRAQNIRAYFIEPGGAGNMLIMAARLGAHAVALGTMGSDEYAQRAYAALADEGVDLRYVQRAPGEENVLVLVVVDDRGEHAFLVREGQGASFVLTEAVQALLRHAHLLLVPGYALHERRMADAVLPAARIAASANVPILVDPGPVSGEPSVRPALLELLRLSTFVLLTAEESLQLSGQSSEEAAAQWLLHQSHGDVVLKLGERGCAVYARGAAPRRFPAPRVAMRDTSGAGDVFDAVFAVEWWRTRDPYRAAQRANRYAAYKVTQLGTGRRCPPGVLPTGWADDETQDDHILPQGEHM